MLIWRQRREHRVFSALLQMVPGLEERLMEGSEDDVVAIAELVRRGRIFRYLCLPWLTWKIQRGASSARSDDTKSMKAPILDWIVPHGQSLTPPLARNVKMDRGFHHERTGALLCPAGMDWSDPEYIYLILPSFKVSDWVFRIKAQLRSGEMTVAGDQWPIFLYARYEYDPEDPWKGLFRSSLLVSVRANISILRVRYL